MAKEGPAAASVMVSLLPWTEPDSDGMAELACEGGSDVLSEEVRDMAMEIFRALGYSLSRSLFAFAVSVCDQGLGS